jgi:hypothetical protein
MDNNQPKNYLIESILITIFCCLPLGIVGIVYGAQVNSKYAVGDFDGALKASNQAKSWVTWGFISGLIIIALSVILYGSLIAALLAFD